MTEMTDIKLNDLHSPSIAGNDNVRAMSESLDPLLQESAAYIENIALAKRLAERSINDDLLVDELAWTYHIDYYDPEMPIEDRLELVANWTEMHALKGTPWAVMKVIEIVFSDAVLSEWYEYGGKPFHFKAGTELTNVEGAEIAKLIEVIFSNKNVRSWLESIDILWQARSGLHVGMAVSQQIEHRLEMRVPWDIPEHYKNLYYYSFQMVRDTAVSFLDMPE